MSVCSVPGTPNISNPRSFRSVSGLKVLLKKASFLAARDLDEG